MGGSSTISPRIFFSETILSWGFTVRLPRATAGQQALVMPPPTTVVGAFMASLGKTLGIKEIRPTKPEQISGTMEKALESTLAASAGLIAGGDVSAGLAKHGEPGRIIGLPYKGGSEARRVMESPSSPEAISRIMPVQALESSYGPGARLIMSWVVDINMLARKLGVGGEDIESIGKLAAWGATRLGSKEGIISVVKAGYGEPVEVGVGESFRIGTYAPAECINPLDPEAFSTLTLWDFNYKPRTFLTPNPLSSNTILIPRAYYPRAKLLNQCIGYKVPDPNLSHIITIEVKRGGREVLE